MKKIIAAIDGLKYSESTTGYAIGIAKQTNTHLVGVFLDDFLYNSYKVYKLVVEKAVTPKQLKGYEGKDYDTRMAAAKKFEDACKKAGVEYSIHHDKSIALQELKHESIYADLLIINSAETLTHYSEEPPTRFIRELLTDVQCPVIIVPHAYEPFGKLVLLYDGEPSSVHAIKMFSYLFPGMLNLPTEVVSVKQKNTSLHLPDNTLMKEFMKQHYPKAKFTVVKGDSEAEILRHLRKVKADACVVLGAYRRGRVSRWFRESMADVLLKETKLPLFIAHN
ncbi:MAG: universal stress protein [Ferruginibacter sp.]|nr:universal stress protein [Ferruginibacter sp.]